MSIRKYKIITDKIKNRVFLYVSRISSLCLVAIGVYLILRGKEERIDNLFIIIFSLFIVLVISTLWHVYKEKKCPNCKAKMLLFKPEDEDYYTTYKYICHECHFAIDLKIKNNRDSGGD